MSTVTATPRPKTKTRQPDRAPVQVDDVPEQPSLFDKGIAFVSKHKVLTGLVVAAAAFVFFVVPVGVIGAVVIVKSKSTNNTESAAAANPTAANTDFAKDGWALTVRKVDPGHREGEFHVYYSLEVGNVAAGQEYVLASRNGEKSFNQAHMNQNSPAKLTSRMTLKQGENVLTVGRKDQQPVLRSTLKLPQ